MAESVGFEPVRRGSDHVAAAPRADETSAGAQASRPRSAGGLLRPSQVPLPGETARQPGFPSPAGAQPHHGLQRLRPSGAPAGAALPPARPSTVPARPIQDVLRGPGQPLAAPIREEMEARLGGDFSQVRVHTDGAARASAVDVGARAYTCGSDIVIGDGGADKHTLAHELIHVTQQNQGPVAGTDHGSGLKVSDPSDVYERAAEANAARVMRVPLNQHRVAAAGTGDQGAPVVHPGAGPRHARAATPVLQRLQHSRNFRTYASAKVPAFTEAAAIATLLDHDEYERRETLDESTLASPGTPSDSELIAAGKFLHGGAAPNVPFPVGPLAPTEALMARLQELMMQAAPGNYSTIRWGPLHLPGSGTWADAELYPGGHAEGSDAGGNPAWMLNLEQRLKEDRSKTLYVRGHLLNRHLGGPGLDYNMVPLTASGDWGANDANGAHSSLIEETVKKMFDRMDSSGDDRVTYLRYRVDAHYGRPARPETQDVAKLAAEFTNIVSRFRTLVGGKRMGADIGGLSEDKVRSLWGQEASNLPYPGKAQAIQALVLGLSHEDWRTPISNLPNTDGNLVIGWITQVPFLESVLKAVHGPSYKLLSLHELQFRMDENAILWDHEDKYVPSHLTYQTAWVQFGRQQQKKGSVEVGLPTALNAAFDPKKPSGK